MENSFPPSPLRAVSSMRRLDRSADGPASPLHDYAPCCSPASKPSKNDSGFLNKPSSRSVLKCDPGTPLRQSSSANLSDPLLRTPIRSLIDSNFADDFPRTLKNSSPVVTPLAGPFNSRALELQANSSPARSSADLVSGLKATIAFLESDLARMQERELYLKAEITGMNSLLSAAADAIEEAEELRQLLDASQIKLLHLEELRQHCKALELQHELNGTVIAEYTEALEEAISCIPDDDIPISSLTLATFENAIKLRSLALPLPPPQSKFHCHENTVPCDSTSIIALETAPTIKKGEEHVKENICVPEGKQKEKDNESDSNNEDNDNDDDENMKELKSEMGLEPDYSAGSEFSNNCRDIVDNVPPEELRDALRWSFQKMFQHLDL